MKYIEWILAFFSTLGVQAVSRLMDQRGMATARSSTLYTSYDVSHYPPDSRDRGGRIIPVYFEVTIVSASAAADTYNLFVIPKGISVVALFCTSNGLGASAGTGVTFQIGDASDDDRYMKATDMDVTAGAGVLCYEGVGYRPTADVIVVGKIGAVAGIVGKIIKGHVLLCQ